MRCAGCLGCVRLVPLCKVLSCSAQPDHPAHFSAEINVFLNRFVQSTKKFPSLHGSTSGASAKITVDGVQRYVVSEGIFAVKITTNMIDPCLLCLCGPLEPRDSAVPADGAAKGAPRDKRSSVPPAKPSSVPPDRQTWLSTRHCAVPVPLCAIPLIFPRAAGKH